MDDTPRSSTLVDQTGNLHDGPLCKDCYQIFMQPDTFKMLASKEGLRHSREKSSMAQSALDGCPLCRELLCIPFEFEIMGEKVQRSNSKENRD
jgi:hypothetical protein